MANPEHLAKLQEGVEAWNRWRMQNPEISPELSGAKLICATLDGANLERADLSHAVLINAELERANLRDADLSDGNLNGVNLKDADLSGANLHVVVLGSSYLRDADLSGATLYNAIIGWATLGSVNLIGAFGLETMEHQGPSTVGIDAVTRSLGRIPDVFLRGCGVPEPFITNMKALVAAIEPIQFYSCFISYSSKNQEFTEDLYTDLQAKHLRVWFAPEDLKIGDRFQERIEESIRLYDKVMIVLSEESVASRWVEREVHAAHEREDRENRTVLFPIRIDDAVMDTTAPWAADLRRTRHIGDFTKWKDHDFYQKALDRLLRDLRAETNADTNTRNDGDAF